MRLALNYLSNKWNSCNLNLSDNIEFEENVKIIEVYLSKRSLVISKKLTVQGDCKFRRLKLNTNQ